MIRGHLKPRRRCTRWRTARWLWPGRAAIGATYTVSPVILIDANVGWTRQRLGAENIDIEKNYGLDDLKIPGTNGPDRLQGGYPRFNISGFSALGNPNVSNPFLFRDNQYVAVGNVSWIRGSHSLRFGGEYTRYEINHFQPQAAFGPRGGFNFTGGLTALRGGSPPNLYNGLADFLLGLANGMGKDVQYVNPAAVRMPSYGFYIRDQWQASRKLTLNYGMRYEYYPFATRDHRGGERYDLATDKVFVVNSAAYLRTPAWMWQGSDCATHRGGLPVERKTVICAGFVSTSIELFPIMRDAYPATISTQFSGNTTFEAAGTLRSGIPEVTGPDLSQGIIALPLAVGTKTFPEKFDRGYIQSYNVTVQRDLGGSFNVQAGYVGSRAVRQTVVLNLNAAGPGGGNAGQALFAKSGRIATIDQLTPFGTSSYNSLQTQLSRR
ncbi:MAG: TonB-dependent receptor [Bryobacteraceae bacterium]